MLMKQSKLAMRLSGMVGSFSWRSQRHLHCESLYPRALQTFALGGWPVYTAFIVPRDFNRRYNINYDYIWQSLLEPAVNAVLGVSNNALTMATLLTIIKNKMICQTLACFRALLLIRGS
jgi:hypothetical protein